ncbi:MAG: response regulator [Planctomycetes bacterium]|nr:response regulator [Planctomycetota bacterium]
MAQILLAEDEPSVASFLSDALALDDHKVEWKPNGREAIRAFAPDRFDLVLTDYHMPLADGPELVRHVRRMEPGFPVVAMSGSAVRREFESFGVDAFLAKPIGLEELLSTVGRIAARRHDERERRGFPRKPIEIPVVLADEDDAWTCRAIDVSQDGLAIEAPAEATLSARAEARTYRAYFRAADGTPADVEVRIARSDWRGSRLGLRFGPLSRWQQDALFELIAK